MKSDVNGREQSEAIDNSNTFVTSANGNTASVAVTATMPGLAGYTAVLTGCIVTAAHVTATVESLFKITGLTTFNTGTGELDYQFVQSATLGGQLVINLTNAIPASAPGIAIVANLASIAGGGIAYISLIGFYRR